MGLRRLLPGLFLPLLSAWDQPIEAYRAMLAKYNGGKAKVADVPEWIRTTRQLRLWMADHDPDYPLYHLAAPEGWNNDPNGFIFDEHGDGLFHRFYQYDKTFSDQCMHGVSKNCTINGTRVQNPTSRVWGHTVSKDGAVWEDWPGIDADSEWDAVGVFSGNCALRDNGKPVCIYSNGACNIGVCAYSDDYVSWTKAGCMTKAPNPASEVNHDTSIWRDGPSGAWYILSGGCTFDGSNTPRPGVPCKGTGQLWTSPDLVTFRYLKSITPGGPGPYWELPYLLPFKADGSAVDNYHHNSAEVYALMFGYSSVYANAYYVGRYNSSNFSFVPLGARAGALGGAETGALEARAAVAGALGAGVASLYVASAARTRLSAPVIGSWPLKDGSGASEVGPAAVLSGAAGVGAGTELFPGSTLRIPWFKELTDPTAFGGVSLSFMLQLNSAGTSAGRANVLIRDDQIWGVEWWGQSMLNFWVRDAHGNYRGIQASICPTPSESGSDSACADGWVRVGMSYNTSAKFADSIAMYAHGVALKPTGAAPGTLVGRLANSTAGLESTNMPGVALADLVVYAGPLSAAGLRAVTEAAVPPPAPRPPPPRPPPPTPPPAPYVPHGWPINNFSDAWPFFYSVNPHAHDRKGPNNRTRRLMFGWVLGDTSAAFKSGHVPYWDSAHSLMRAVTVDVDSASIVQLPAKGAYEPLRRTQQPSFVAGPIDIAAGGAGYLTRLTGDALEIRAVFATQGAGITATSFGLALRVVHAKSKSNSIDDSNNFACRIGYSPLTQSLSAPGMPSWRAAITPQPSGPGTVELHIFLDRSIIETYTGGAALTSRCFLPAYDAKHNGTAESVDLWTTGGSAKLLSLSAWRMSTMWGDVTTAAT